MTLSVDDEVEEEFRRAVDETSSGKKGSLGRAASEAMKLWIREKRQEELAEEALELLEDGFEMGERLYEEREELHR